VKFTSDQRDTIRRVEREHYRGGEMTEGQARCVLTLCALAPPYRIQTVGRWRIDQWGIRVRYRGDLATHDMDEITRLVVAAHRWCVRVQISPGKPVVPLAPMPELAVRRDPVKGTGSIVGHARVGGRSGVYVVWALAETEWLPLTDPRLVHGRSVDDETDRFSGPTLDIATHFRTYDADHSFERHPTLRQLAARAARLDTAIQAEAVTL
jgi:hypothetical protein